MVATPYKSTLLNNPHIDEIIEVPIVSDLTITRNNIPSFVKEYSDQKFDKIDQKFDKIDQRFDRVDSTLKAIEGSLKQKVNLDEFTALEGRVGSLEAKA